MLSRCLQHCIKQFHTYTDNFSFKNSFFVPHSNLKGNFHKLLKQQLNNYKKSSQTKLDSLLRKYSLHEKEKKQLYSLYGFCVAVQTTCVEPCKCMAASSTCWKTTRRSSSCSVFSLLWSINLLNFSPVHCSLYWFMLFWNPNLQNLIWPWDVQLILNLSH